MLRIVERHSTSKPRLLRMLSEIRDEAWCHHTLYLKAESLSVGRAKQVALHTSIADETLIAVLEGVKDSDTGAVLFLGDEKVIAVSPPFPLDEDGISMETDTSALERLLERDLLIGVVLLRLQRYAIGVLRGEALAATKTSSRYVKNRHRAGGQSQRRFERSRERTVRELYDKTCEIVRDVFSPFGKDIDYVLMGGEQNTLRGLMERCRYLRDMEGKILNRRLQVDRPNQDALLEIAFEVWKSRVLVFESS